MQLSQKVIDQISEAVNANNPYATALLGVLLYEGKDIGRDPRKGMSLLSQAAKQGVLWAKDLLLCINWVNKSSDVRAHALISSDAINQLQESTSKNDWGRAILGDAYLHGYGVPKDPMTGLGILRFAVVHGNLWAASLLNDQPAPDVPIKIDPVKDDPTTKSKARSDAYKDPAKRTPEEKLQALVGLQRVKEEVATLKNVAKVQAQRKRAGLPTMKMSYHCVFSGSPGTGKTTVARIVAEIYKEMGILKKGHLVEADRQSLIAEYLGQTAPKVDAKVNEALDGILFIDEAYALTQGGKDDQYGQEAVATLLKRMEDYRDRLIVILAGYEDEMKKFIDTNPGLQSRFNTYIHFDDYTPQELLHVFMGMLRDQQYTITEEAKKKVFDVIYKAWHNKDHNFGNARYVRNLIEKVLRQQANRLAANDHASREELMEITADDICNLS